MLSFFMQPFDFLCRALRLEGARLPVFRTTNANQLNCDRRLRISKCPYVRSIGSRDLGSLNALISKVIFEIFAKNPARMRQGCQSRVETTSLSSYGRYTVLQLWLSGLFCVGKLRRRKALYIPKTPWKRLIPPESGPRCSYSII